MDVIVTLRKIYYPVCLMIRQRCETMATNGVKPLGHYTDDSTADRDKGRFYCSTCAEMVGDHADIVIHKARTPSPCPHGHHIVDLEL